MSETASTNPPQGVLGHWNAMPLYVRIVIAMFIGMIAGLGLGQHAVIFEIPSKVILQLLGALAPPLILIAVTHVLMTTDISGKEAANLAGLLLLNTTVAILIGLTIANVLKPGAANRIEKPEPVAAAGAETAAPAGADNKPDQSVAEDKSVSVG